jgi:hypothetical protein
MSNTMLQLPPYIVTRSGDTIPFDGEKICSAIERAGKATRAFYAAEARLLSNQALRVITHRFRDCLDHALIRKVASSRPAVEEIARKELAIRLRDWHLPPRESLNFPKHFAIDCNDDCNRVRTTYVPQFERMLFETALSKLFNRKEKLPFGPAVSQLPCLFELSSINKAIYRVRYCPDSCFALLL